MALSPAHAPVTPTLQAALAAAEPRLLAAGVEEARLEAEWLLAHVAGIPRLMLGPEGARRLTPPQAAAWNALLERRATGEPLQHLLGTANFCGLEIEATRDALIPRPETELLAEMAWEHLRPLPGQPRFLDFGTGTGCLALAILRHCHAALAEAADISAPALALARRNAENLRLAGRIQFHLGDGLEALPPGARFHLIVSNPPYIPTGEIPGLQREVRCFDPHLALDGGADGLDFYRRLAAGAAPLLHPGGKIMLEFGEGQEAALIPLFESHNWVEVQALPDYTRRARFLTAATPPPPTP